MNNSVKTNRIRKKKKKIHLAYRNEILHSRATTINHDQHRRQYRCQTATKSDCVVWQARRAPCTPVHPIDRRPWHTNKRWEIQPERRIDEKQQQQQQQQQQYIILLLCLVDVATWWATSHACVCWALRARRCTTANVSSNDRLVAWSRTNHRRAALFCADLHRRQIPTGAYCARRWSRANSRRSCHTTTQRQHISQQQRHNNVRYPHYCLGTRRRHQMRQIRLERDAQPPRLANTIAKQRICRLVSIECLHKAAKHPEKVAVRHHRCIVSRARPREQINTKASVRINVYTFGFTNKIWYQLQWFIVRLI